MEDLEIGGSWDNDYINYIEFDLYACKDGIDYDEKNENCSTYEEIIKMANENNSFEFELYYPVVHYQPMNKTNPILVQYTWLIKEEKLHSHWGYAALSGDSYSNGNKRDLMNEGSSSRFYSFNIYLKSEIIYYNRQYKKFLLILADGLPIVGFIFTFFKLIAKVFKVSVGNQKLTELLFENLQEKKPKITKDKINFLKVKIKKNKLEKKNNTIKRVDNNSIKLERITNINNIGISTNNYINDISSIQLYNNEDRKNSFGSRNKKKFLR
jgi:hypothetical protein